MPLGFHHNAELGALAAAKALVEEREDRALGVQVQQQSGDHRGNNRYHASEGRIDAQRRQVRHEYTLQRVLAVRMDKIQHIACVAEQMSGRRARNAAGAASTNAFCELA